MIHSTRKDARKVQDFMTPNPVVVKKDVKIQDALSLMRKESIRHLPVTNENNELVGVITDRDIKCASAFEQADHMKVSDLMILKPYAVESVVSLRNVALYMAENRLGCALVLRNGQLAGIFTVEDGLRALGEMLQDSEQASAA